MRERHRRKRKQQIRTGLPIRRKSIMAANEKNKILSVVFGLTNDLYESSGIHHAAYRVEEDLAGAGMPGEEVKASRDNLAHVAACVPAAPLNEFRGYGIRMRIARFADVIEKEFQWLLHPAPGEGPAQTRASAPLRRSKLQGSYTTAGRQRDTLNNVILPKRVDDACGSGDLLRLVWKNDTRSKMVACGKADSP